jgi:ABC-type branched-subunit amino acid transport system substrate-binding protein
VTFGCWTSVSRKSVLPVYKELNGLLFYPVQYEGEELEYNVFYTGAAPNQQAIPAVEYLMSKDGGDAKRFVLLGTDYVYPRTTNKILRAFLKSKGVADADIMEEYTPFGHSDYQTIIAKIKKFASEGKKTAVVSTINGDSNVPFYKELGNAGSRRPTCRWWLSRWAKRNCAASIPSRWSATWRRGTTSCRKNPRERQVQCTATWASRSRNCPTPTPW